MKGKIDRHLHRDCENRFFRAPEPSQNTDAIDSREMLLLDWWLLGPLLHSVWIDVKYDKGLGSV
jgi:hypothetical protein